jgi:hypothetical protein
MAFHYLFAHSEKGVRELHVINLICLQQFNTILPFQKCLYYFLKFSKKLGKKPCAINKQQIQQTTVKN